MFKSFAHTIGLALAIFLAASPAPAQAWWSFFSASPIVHTSLGTLVGAKYSEHRAFLGVPYAEPPLGNKRWQAPQGLY